MVNRKLLAFTDTKAAIMKRRTQFKKKGYVSLLIKKEYSAYGLYGVKGKK